MLKCNTRHFSQFFLDINNVIIFEVLRFYETDTEFITTCPVKPVLRDDLQLSVDEYRRKLYETVSLNEFNTSRSISYTQ